MDDKNKVPRRVRFRIGPSNMENPIYDINIHAYLVVSRVIKHENNTGWGNYWPPLQINKNYLPEITDYWTITHFIHAMEYESPLKIEYDDQQIIKISIAVFATGKFYNGKFVYGKKRYNWTEKDTIFGTAKLKQPGEKSLPQESFDIIVEQEDNYEWPNIRYSHTNPSACD